MSSLPLRYWCDTCGGFLFRSESDARGLFEVICRNRRCPSRIKRINAPSDASDEPKVERRFRHGTAGARSA